MAEDMDIDSPRGIKRKADGQDLDKELGDPVQPRRIQALDPDVVNKIAAGEIIVAPVHALKELIENAVDAGSTSLEVLVKEGGLKLLQITDNGCGIAKEDLPILCERFTTSKLQKFEDLQSIATYGFRGEALASISHIAHLTVTTKTGSDHAWRANYGGGKLVPAKPGQPSDPRPVAGRKGTQIMVEDLFYNVPTRRRAFRSASDEYRKIVDMVGRYAVHCSHVAFSCRKHGDNSTSISVPATASVVDRIRLIKGASIANELVEFSTSDDRWGFKAKGFATNSNYHVSEKTNLMLFINHRCVESTNIRKAIEQTYAAFLPKNGHPFVYLSLEIDPHRVDVNVHPTKREVSFLNEDEIMQAVCEHIRSKLAAVDTSRTFLTQTLLSGVPRGTPDGQNPDSTPARAKLDSGLSGRRSTRADESRLVRTDTNMRKITSMLPAAGSMSSSSRTRATAGNGAKDADVEMLEYEEVEREAFSCRLASVRKLRQAVRDDMHVELTGIFANHTFVGVVDERRRLAAMQGGVKLYLIDYGRACFEYLYQVGLTDFGNFGSIQFSPPLDLRELLTGAAEIEKQARVTAGGATDDEDVDPAELVERVAEQLIERHEMLSEYFSLEINPAGELISIPLLVKGYMPPIVKLPRFLLRLGPNVDWDEEEACFDSFLKELAAFYVPEQLPPEPIGDEDQELGESEAGQAKGKGKQKQGEREFADEETKARRDHVRWALEHVFFPAFKARLVATNTLMKGGILEVADLKGLYRVFERC